MTGNEMGSHDAAGDESRKRKAGTSGAAVHRITRVWADNNCTSHRHV